MSGTRPEPALPTVEFEGTAELNPTAAIDFLKVVAIEAIPIRLGGREAGCGAEVEQGIAQLAEAATAPRARSEPRAGDGGESRGVPRCHLSFIITRTSRVKQDDKHRTEKFVVDSGCRIGAPVAIASLGQMI